MRFRFIKENEMICEYCRYKKVIYCGVLIDYWCHVRKDEPRLQDIYNTDFKEWRTDADRCMEFFPAFDSFSHE
jgi:hypothetical protein